MRRILLIEPSYHNKYPPLGLMKISTYHKLLGDEVVFYKGKNLLLQQKMWDRIYITTLFTFRWNNIINTIKYYLNSTECKNDIFVGGPMATIMALEISQQKGFENITVYKGLLDKPRILDDNDYIVDDMIPDYSIIDISKNAYLNYNYPVNDAYFVHTTRGCIRKCEFCAVPHIEPKYKNYIDIKPKINTITKQYGKKSNLIIMDNNIIASRYLEQIIDDIIACGYGLNNNDYEYFSNERRIIKKRYVDFNQGLDARLLCMNPEKVRLLSKVAVKPIRIAFDYADDEFVKIYEKCMWLIAKNGIKYASNYILFNYTDGPNELYKRLKINVLLNNKFEAQGLITRIFSFPMKYSPIFKEEAKDRKYIGVKWSHKQLRGIQCILNATHGLVGPKSLFFYKAFGKNLKEFNMLLWMPDKYILYRNENIKNGNSGRWKKLYIQLNSKERSEFHKLIGDNIFTDKHTNNTIIMKLLKCYEKFPVRT